MPITGVVVRRRVTDLDAAVGFYEQLTGEHAHRFAASGAELASVGPFLLFSAPDDVGDRLARVVATLTVTDLDAERDRHVGATRRRGRRCAPGHPERASDDRPAPGRGRLRVRGEMTARSTDQFRRDATSDLL